MQACGTWLEVHRYQLVAAIVGLGHLVLVLAYLGVYGIPNDDMVTTELFNYLAFRGAMMAFSTLETLIFLAYASRFRTIDVLGMALTVFWAVMSYAGFMTLASNYDVPRHFTGVAMYIGAGAFTWLLVLCLTKDQNKKTRAYDYAVYACVLVSLCLAGAFLALYNDGNQPDSWLLEQLALIGYILVFILFYSYHTWNPWLLYPEAPTQDNKSLFHYHRINLVV